MSPRNRKPKNKDLRGTHVQVDIKNGVTYYRYVNKRAYDTEKDIFFEVNKMLGNSNPQSGNYITRQEAIDSSRALDGRLAAPRAIEIANQISKRLNKSKSITQVLTGFRNEYLPTRRLSAGYLYNLNFLLNKYEREIGNKPFTILTIEYMRELFSELSEHAYIKHRELFVQIFKYAIHIGVHPISDGNLAEALLKKLPPKRQRQRLTIDAYKAIYACADEWLQIAMDFMLLSLQPREIAVAAQHTKAHFEDYKTPDASGCYGILKVIRGKTGDHIKIRVMESLYKDVILRSRQTEIASPFIVHRLGKKHASKSHHTQVFADYLTKSFKKAVELSGVYKDDPRNQWATPHEIRSLGGILMEQAGYTKEQINLLRGHEDDRMFELYKEDHGVTWKEATAGLNLKEILLCHTKK